MNVIDIHARREPTFATAQGTFERWQHPVRFRDAMIRLDRFRDGHVQRYRAADGPPGAADVSLHTRFYLETLEEQLEAFRRQDPDAPIVIEVPIDLFGEELKEGLERLQDRLGGIQFLAPPAQPWYANIPDDAAPVLQQSIEHVTVAVPDRSRTESEYRGVSRHETFELRIVVGHRMLQRFTELGTVREESIDDHDVQPPGSEHLYWSQPHPEEAVLLLAPWHIVYGWRERPGSRTATTALGRPADRIALDRLVPFDDPRMMGHERCPNHFFEADDLELVIDREHGVIVEWAMLLNGEPYERGYFSALAFDVPVDPAMFTIPPPADVPGRRP